MTIDQLENKINDLKNNSIDKNMFEVTKDILEQINYLDNKIYTLEREKQQLQQITSQLNDSILKK